MCNRPPSHIPGNCPPVDHEGAGTERAFGREPDGQFTGFANWVNKARSWIGGTGAVCIDAKGRRCASGADFQRARDEGAFPIRYWIPVREGDVTWTERDEAGAVTAHATEAKYGPLPRPEQRELTVEEVLGAAEPSKLAPATERLGPNMCLACGGQGTVPAYDEERSFVTCRGCGGTGVQSARPVSPHFASAGMVPTATPPPQASRVEGARAAEGAALGGGGPPVMPSAWVGNPARALGWALDMMEMYERRLIDTFGDDERLVYSTVHRSALRAACWLAEFRDDDRGREIYDRFRGRPAGPYPDGSAATGGPPVQEATAAEPCGSCGGRGRVQCAHRACIKTVGHHNCPTCNGRRISPAGETAPGTSGPDTTRSAVSDIDAAAGEAVGAHWDPSHHEAPVGNEWWEDLKGAARTAIERERATWATEREQLARRADLLTGGDREMVRVAVEAHDKMRDERDRLAAEVERLRAAMTSRSRGGALAAVDTWLEEWLPNYLTEAARQSLCDLVHAGEIRGLANADPTKRAAPATSPGPKGDETPQWESDRQGRAAAPPLEPLTVSPAAALGWDWGCVRCGASFPFERVACFVCGGLRPWAVERAREAYRDACGMFVERLAAAKHDEEWDVQARELLAKHGRLP